AFAAGKVDAVAIWVPYTKEIEKQVGKDNIVKLGDNNDFYPQYIFPSSWVVNPKFLESKPEVVEKFMRAWVKMNDYRMKNGDETLKLTSKFTQVPEDSLKEMVPVTKFIESEKQATYFKDGTAKKWYEGFETMFVKNGKLKEVVPAEKFIVTEPMIKAVEKTK
ncbi:MAG: hypothetical protein VB130_11140, partial [Clostridium sp.]|nr:hypothetical protein [Clostridium sp.]